MANPTYVSKQLTTAASSTGIGTLSTASPGVATINTSNLDTQRRIIIWSTGATLASATITIVGSREGGAGIAELRETLTGPSSVGGATPTVATTRDFLSVTSVSASSVINVPANFGTNTQGGTAWQSVNLDITPIQIAGALTFSSTTLGMIASIEYTYDNPFAFGQQFGGAPGAGGLAQPINAAPVTFISTSFSSATGNISNAINVNGTALMVPIAAWRMTLTSSSSTVGNVNVAAIQAGIG